MNRLRPSAQTVAAILSCCDKPIAAVAVPHGEWLEFDPALPGYDVGQLLIVFADNSSLSLWSTLHRYGPEPWHETCLLEASINAAAAAPLELRNAGALQGFVLAPPLNEVLAGGAMTEPELIVRLVDTYPSSEQDYLPADSLRVVVGAHTVVFSTEGQGVLPLHLVVRCHDLPPYRRVPTGERNWLSSLKVAPLKRPPPGDAGEA